MKNVSKPSPKIDLASEAGRTELLKIVEQLVAAVKEVQDVLKAAGLAS